MLENSLTAKEKIISELNMEIHNVETALANEREDHVVEIKKLNSLLNKKVKIVLFFVVYTLNFYSGYGNRFPIASMSNVCMRHFLVLN